MERFGRLMDVAGPTIRRRQLGIELRRLRDAAGISRDEAAAAIGSSATKMTHLESGRNSPRKAELIVLLQHYGADEDRLPALEELRIEASQRGWWSTARLPEWLAAYVGLEADAVSVRALELELIPGLLQTEQYAREVHILAGHMTPTEDVDRRVSARMRRQSRLVGDDPLHLSVVMSEAALQRCARHTDVAVPQLRHLVEQGQRPNIELRVLPFDIGLHVSMSGSFSLLSFPDGLLPDVAYQEYAVGGHVIDDEGVVARLGNVYSELRGQTLGVDESLALIAEFAENTG